MRRNKSLVIVSLLPFILKTINWLEVFDFREYVIFFRMTVFETVSLNFAIAPSLVTVITRVSFTPETANPSHTWSQQITAVAYEGFFNGKSLKINTHSVG